MKSIRTFLILTVLAILVLFNFIAAIHGYYSSMDKAEKLFDDQMLDTAKLIANLDIKLNEGGFNYSSSIAFQIWQGSQLIASSENAPMESLGKLEPGYSFTNFDGYRWRTLTYYDRKKGNWIFLAERSDIRYILAEEVILESILPLLLGIPLVGLFIWIIINRGLNPLNLLSDILRNKEADDLSKISMHDLPKELEQVVFSINTLIERLRMVIEREKQFTSDAAHELRTPISVLKIQLHNLSEEVPSESNSFIQLKSGVDRMQHLVEQLLCLYRTSPEEFSKHLTEVNLCSLAQEVIADLYPIFESKQQTLELSGENCTIEGNPFALTTLLQNLLNNANKYTPEGGNIKLSISKNATSIRLNIEDSGPGLPEELRDRIFERFFRADQPSQSAVSGCGLGLAIVKHIVDLHGAKIHVSPSSFTSGCAFVINFA